METVKVRGVTEQEVIGNTLSPGVKNLDVMESCLDDATRYEIMDSKGLPAGVIMLQPLYGEDLGLISRLFKSIIGPIMDSSSTGKEGEVDMVKALSSLDDSILGELHALACKVMYSSVPKPEGMDDAKYQRIIMGYVSINLIPLVKQLIEINIGPLSSVLGSL